MLLPNKILCVDMGNSLVKMSFSLDGIILITEKCTFIELEDHLRALLHRQNFEGAILSSVIGISDSFLALLKANIATVLVFNKDLKLPIQLLYQSKNTLGNDRIALACGLQTLQLPALIIAMGSCVTYNLLNKKGEFLGGNISPGLLMRLKSMNYYTQKLPLVDADGNVDWVADNTELALRSGTVMGIVGEINYYVQHFLQQFPGLKVIVTGGDAALVKPFLNFDYQMDADLLMKGLLNVWQLNVPS